MKKVLVMTLVLCGCFMVKAQEQEEAGYTDEELTKYASVMVWAENEKKNMSTTLVERIKSDTILASRYNDIKGAYGNEEKLEEVGATDAQVAAYEAVITFEDSIKASFKEVYVDKIKNDIGVSLYNRLKGDLKSDDSVKVRYEAIYTELLEGSNEEEDGDSESAEDTEG